MALIPFKNGSHYFLKSPNGSRPMNMQRTLFVISFVYLLFVVPLASAGDGVVTFNFQDVEIQSVIKSVSKLTGKTFLVDPAVKGKVTLISSEGLAEDEIYGVFLSVLQVHDYAAIESGSVVKIIPQVRAKQDMVNAYVDEEAPTKPGDRFITRLYKLKHVPANRLVPILRPLIAPKSYLAAHEGSNMLIISDRAANVERLIKIIKRIDHAGTGEIQVLRLEYADARDVSSVVQGLMKSTPRKGSASQRLQVVADERTNSILISGDEGDILRVKALVAHLDTPVQTEGSTQVIFLRYAKAKDLVSILTGVGKEIQRSSSAKSPKKTVRKRGNEMAIQADEATNALIISASPQVIKSLRSVIRKLDIRREQVVIEAVIAEISTGSKADLGIQWRSTDGTADDDGFLGGTNFNGGSGIYGASANPLAAVTNGFNFGYFRGTTDILGTEILNLGAMVQALAGDGDTNILSTPTLVTMDNEEAEISVGQNVPFVTGSYTSTGSSSNPGNPFQTIKRKDVGLMLKVKPQINEGNTIRLDIEQETSSLSQSESGVDLITNTRKIKTSVMVEDGKILVLGGLIQDDVKESVQKVPFLGDIPFLGVFFRYNSSSHNKRNLMVFLRPHIIRNATDSSRITFDKYDYMRRLQQDAAEDGIYLLPGVSPGVMPEWPEE